MLLRFEVRDVGGVPAVRLVRDGKVGAPSPFKLPADIRERAAIEERATKLADLPELGARLWASLTPPGIREIVEGTLAEASEDAPLVLELSLPEGEISALPWETLNHVGKGIDFAVDPRFSLVRAPPEGAALAAIPPSAGPLRVLGVIPIASGLKVGQEWSGITEIAASAEGAYALTPLHSRVTPSALKIQLESVERFHVLHFIGHGDHDDAEGTWIELNAEAGPTQRLDSMALANMLVGAGVRLLVLNSCKGASPAVSPFLAAMAPRVMLTAGVPFVIAMRYSIPDSVAIRFSQTFYRELAQGRRPGHVDSAVQRARHELLLNATDTESLLGYVTPVLTMAGGAGALFRPRPRAKRPVSMGAPTTSSLAIPAELLDALKACQCIPVVGGAFTEGDHVRKGTSPPGVAALSWELANACEYAEKEELGLFTARGDWLADAAFARVCQSFQESRGRPKLIEQLAKLLEGATPPAALRELATWKVPGFIQTQLDGLLDVALASTTGPLRVLNYPRASSAPKGPGGAADARLLVNLRGSIRDQMSLVLTESQLEELVSGFPRECVDEISVLVNQQGRTLLFLGVSPRHPLARRVAHLIDTREESLQGRPYFVWKDPSPPDVAYWNRYRVAWIREDPAAFVAAISAALGE